MHANTVIGPRGLPISFQVRDLRVEPGLVLAPMEGVTDLAFRRLVRAMGPVGMTWTEFVPGEGIARGEERWLRMAAFDPDERPVVVQVYGRRPDVLAEAARLMQYQGCSAIDINMGCPSKKVCAHSGGSALMKEPQLVAEIVRAVRAAVQVPLLVKMRAGFDHQTRNAPEIAWIAQEEGAEAVTVHWRTRADLFSGQRELDTIAAVVDRLRVPVIGNGDIVDVQSAEAMLRQTGCDGLMVGRGAMRNPWIFVQLAAWLHGDPLPRIESAQRHQALLRYLDSCQEQFAQAPRGRHGDPDRATLGRLKQLCKHFLDEQGDEARTAVLRSETLAEARSRVADCFAS
jgi:tRNA-dihydrouridine synthase B